MPRFEVEIASAQETCDEPRSVESAISSDDLVTGVCVAWLPENGMRFVT
jgi:hypothetical protein